MWWNRVVNQGLDAITDKIFLEFITSGVTDDEEMPNMFRGERCDGTGCRVK